MLLLGAVALVGERVDVQPLQDWLVRLAVVLGVWLVCWPLWDTGRAALRPRALS